MKNYTYIINFVILAPLMNILTAPSYMCEHIPFPQLYILNCDGRVCPFLTIFGNVAPG